MRKLNGKTNKLVKKSLAAVLSMAMVVTSLTIASADADAKTKGTVKSVKVTSPVVNGGKLVLKKGQKKQIKYTVDAAKGASKKVTVTTSNKKVAKVTKSGSKVFVKAVAKKGNAKITIASKANKKKKAVLKVAVGAPIKKVVSASVTQTQTVKDNTYLNQLKKEGKLTLDQATKKASKVTKKTTKASSKAIKIYTIYTDKRDKEHEKEISYKFKLNVKTNPAKAAVKSMKWTSSKPSLAKVDSTGTILIRKTKDVTKEADYSLGTCTLTGRTKDGTNKSVKVKINVIAKANLAPPRVYEKDTREGTVVEDFESYEAGTAWTKYTAGGYKDSGKMTVVKDPENPDNKVLKVDFTGKDQAYDFAPAFTIKLPEGKTLGNYSAVRLKSRIISGDSDCNYKTVGVYFDGANTIKDTDYFFTSSYDGTAAKEAPSRDLRFGVNCSMATGVDEDYNVPGSVVEGNAVKDEDIIALSPYKQYNNKVFPTFYTAYSNGDSSAVSPGFAENEDKDVPVGFQQNTLEFNNPMIESAWISDDDTTPLLKRNTFDMVLGATYKGSQGLSYDDYHMILYLDDIQFMSGDIPCTAIALTGSKSLALGASVTLQTEFTPANTTQTDLTWTSSDESIATVDAFGKVTASTEKTGKVTITCACKANPAVKQTHEINVYEPVAAEEDYDALKEAKVAPVAEDATIRSETTAELTDKGLQINFTKNNESIVLDLGKEIDMTAYKSVVISGNTPGQIAMEFYSSSFDMNADKWWDKAEGATYPFYNGSCGFRYEDGGFNKTLSGGLVATDETLRYPLAQLADGKNGDWTKIRYVVFKSNNNPSKPKGWGNNNYFITSFKFATGETINAKSAGFHILDMEKNVAEKDGNKTSYYIDNITDTNTVEKHDTTMNISDMKYIRVKVKDTASVKLGLIADGKKLADAEIVGEETGSGERFVYFSLADCGWMDLHSMDAVSVEVDAGGTVEEIGMTKGEIGYKEGQKKIDVSGGTCTEVTEDKYGAM